MKSAQSFIHSKPMWNLRTQQESWQVLNTNKESAQPHTASSAQSFQGFSVKKNRNFVLQNMSQVICKENRCLIHLLGYAVIQL